MEPLKDITVLAVTVYLAGPFCSMILARLGAPEIVSERVLNHQAQGLTKIYNVHEYLDEKRDALSRWAQEVQNIVEPPPPNVVPLAAGRETA